MAGSQSCNGHAGSLFEFIWEASRSGTSSFRPPWSQILAGSQSCNGHAGSLFEFGSPAHEQSSDTVRVNSLRRITSILDCSSSGSGHFDLLGVTCGKFLPFASNPRCYKLLRPAQLKNKANRGTQVRKLRNFQINTWKKTESADCGLTKIEDQNNTLD